MVFMPHWPTMPIRNAIDLSLDRVKALLAALGNPQQNLPPVVHVAGTNGKGSTVAFLRSFLEQAGYTTHVYTSPHLLNFNERIRVSGHIIDDNDLYQVMEECRIASETHAIPVTFFEATTAGAFLAFSRSKADIVLLETGLGGRLDATNVIAHPAATVITPISLDHVEYLGPTVEMIAREKAGILKSGSPCVVSLQSPEVDEILQKTAANLNVPLYAFEYDWIVEKTGNQLQFRSQRGDMLLPAPNLAGDHQYLNAATAIATTQILDGFAVSERDIAKGIQTAYWPGRLQQLTHGPLVKALPQGWEFWLDGAHNEAGAFTLANAIAHWNDRPLYIICGMTQGRDIAKFLSHFKDRTPLVCGVTVLTEPSAQRAEAVATAAASVGLNAIACDSIEDAIARCVAFSPLPARILACGSLYLVSDSLKVNHHEILR